MKKLLLSFTLLALFASCAKDDGGDGDGSGSTLTISGTMGTAFVGPYGEKGISAIDLTALRMYCVALVVFLDVVLDCVF